MVFAIHSHESAIGVHMFPILNPPPSPSHPSGSSQCTRPEHPVICIGPGLVIYFTYGNIHVTICIFGIFSQIIPPSLSSTASLYNLVTFSLGWIGISIFFLIIFSCLPRCLLICTTLGLCDLMVIQETSSVESSDFSLDFLQSLVGRLVPYIPWVSDHGWFMDVSGVKT